jgi:hypothetical protein
MIYTLSVPRWFRVPETRCEVRRTFAPFPDNQAAVLTVEGSVSGVRRLIGTIVTALDRRSRSHHFATIETIVSTAGGDSTGKRLTLALGRLRTYDRRCRGQLPTVEDLRSGAGKRTAFDRSLPLHDFMLARNRAAKTASAVTCDVYRCLRVGDARKMKVVKAKVYGRRKIILAGLPICHGVVDILGPGDAHGLRLSVLAQESSRLSTCEKGTRGWSA